MYLLLLIVSHNSCKIKKQYSKMPCKGKVGVTLITAEGRFLAISFNTSKAVISREVEAAALEGIRVGSQEISLFTPGPKAAIRHHDQADPPYSEKLELDAYPNREACKPRDQKGRACRKCS